MREDEIRRELDEVRPFDVPRRPSVPYFLDDVPPGPEDYDPDWDDIVPPSMRRFGWAPRKPMYYGYMGQPITMRQWIVLHRWPDKTVARTQVVGRKDVAEVSTVYLGLDHSFIDLVESDALIFESMVFGGGELDQDFMHRYTSWHEALAGHRAIVQLVELELVELATDDVEVRHSLDDVAREFGVDLDGDDE